MTACRWRALALTAASLLCGACRFDYGRVAMLTDFPIQAVQLDEAELAAAVEVSGADLRSVYLLFPAGDHPTVEAALQDALSRTDADALVDVRVQHELFWIPFVYGWSGYRVTGRAVRLLDAPSRPRDRRSRLLQER